ncbi:hypothetical protein [Algivirga pacifica]
MNTHKSTKRKTPMEREEEELNKLIERSKKKTIALKNLLNALNKNSNS